MFQTTGGAYEFAHYASGKWTFAAVPTSGLPGLMAGSQSFDLYAISRIPGTRSVLASGDVFYQDTANEEHQDSLIFRFTP